VGIESVNAFELPLLNTILLLSSGATVTYSHHALIQGNRRASLIGLILTIVLALAFTACQGIEYYNTSFSISDSVYGTVFFASTGLHGFHVILGAIFLIVSLFRLTSYHFTDSHHLGYESAILYWHFVDIVWLFLFVSVYWWGGESSITETDILNSMAFITASSLKEPKSEVPQDAIPAPLAYIN
jgi:cytochrome c oxidase subunit 3